MNLEGIEFDIWSILDVILLAILIYFFIKLTKDSIAANAFFGVLFIYLLYRMSKWMNLQIIHALLEPFAELGLIALLIVFNREIHSFLVIIGRKITLKESNLFTKLMGANKNLKETNMLINELLSASKTLKDNKTGALIVISTIYEESIFENSNILDCNINADMIVSIFNKNSPLHDGAVIIFENKIKSAGCILPLTKNTKIPQHYGLRHRAAIGITEQINAVAIVVSEQNSQISFCKSGKVKPHLSMNALEKLLVKEFT